MRDEGTYGIHVRVSPALLKKIDEAVQAGFTSRSGFIREAVLMRLNGQYVADSPKMEATLELLRQAGRQRRRGEV